MNLTKREIKIIQDRYRELHPYCLNPYRLNGLWRFCRRGPADLNHLAHIGGKVEDPAAYYSLCGYRARGRCHMGLFHQEDLPAEGYGVNLLRLYAVKYILGETTTEQAEDFMQRSGVTWWRPERDPWDATITSRIKELAKEMESLEQTELPRLRRLQIPLTAGGGGL